MSVMISGGSWEMPEAVMVFRNGPGAGKSGEGRGWR